LNRDQYGRAIAEVFEPATDMDVSATLLQKGYATLYTGKGAEYDGRRELLESLQAQAKSKKVGIWSLGDQVVTPADFKRVQRNAKIQ
jgi:endonuclease YncB( thermonuclease family)